MNLYPEMNEKIVGILRIGDEPSLLYAAALIESLQSENAALRERQLTIECPHCGLRFRTSDKSVKWFGVWNFPAAPDGKEGE